MAAHVAVTGSNILSIPGALVAVGAIIGGAIVGFLDLVKLLRKEGKDDKKEKLRDRQDADEANLYTIKSLKEKIDILEQKVQAQANQLAQQTGQILALQQDNESMKALLTGRDPETIKFQKQGFEVMAMVPKLMEMTERTNKNVENLYKLINKSLELMEKRMTTTTVVTGPAPQQVTTQ